MRRERTTTKRRGLSETLGTFILVATAIAGAVIATSAFYVLTGPGQQNASMQVQPVQVTQGTYVSSIELLVSNIGTTPLSSLTIQILGTQGGSSSLSGSLSLVDASTGAALSATTATNLASANPTFSANLATSLLPGKAVVVTVTISSTSQGAVLFAPNTPYILTVTGTPYTQAVVKVVATSA